MAKDVYIKKSAALHAVLHNEGQAAVAAIEAIKPEDVVAVVRCKDCINRDHGTGTCFGDYVPPFHYCADGEREEQK